MCVHTPGHVGKKADSDSAGLGQGPRFCFSNKLPDDGDAAGPWTTLFSNKVSVSQSWLHIRIAWGALKTLDAQTASHPN